MKGRLVAALPGCGLRSRYRCPVGSADLAGEPLLDVLAEPFVDGKLRGLGASRRKLSLPLRYRGPVLELPASSGRVASQLPRVGRRVAAESAAQLRCPEPRPRREPSHIRPVDVIRPPSLNEIRRLYDRIVLAPPAPPGPGSPCTGTAGAPATRPEPAPAPTAPRPPALTHRKITGCSTGYDPIPRADLSRSDLVHRGSPNRAQPSRAPRQRLSAGRSNHTGGADADGPHR